MSSSSSSSSSSESDILNRLTPQERIDIETTFQGEMSKLTLDVDDKIAEVKKIYKKKMEKIQKDLEDTLEMIEEQKRKKITYIAMKKAEMIMNVLKRNAIEKKKQERKEQLEKNLSAFKEDNERLRRLNSGEGI